MSICRGVPQRCHELVLDSVQIISAATPQLGLEEGLFDRLGQKDRLRPAGIGTG